MIGWLSSATGACGAQLITPLRFQFAAMAVKTIATRRSLALARFNAAHSLSRRLDDLTNLGFGKVPLRLSQHFGDVMAALET